MPRVIENDYEVGLEGSQIIKNETSERFGGVLGALGFMNEARCADKGNFLAPILAPTGFRKADPLCVS